MMVKKNLWIIKYKSYLALSLQMCLKLGAQWCFCANSLCQRDFKMFIQLVLKWLLHFTVALLFWIHFICSWIPESCFSLPFFFSFFFSFSFSCFYDRSGIYQKLRTSFTIKAVMHVEVSLSIGIFTKASNWLLYQIK